MFSNQQVILVSGPTASGKSWFAVELAEALGGEIINVDSVQCYKHFNIGAAKPSLDLTQKVTHHLFNYQDPSIPLNITSHLDNITYCVNELHTRKREAILVGSSGMHLTALFAGLSLYEKNDKDKSELNIDNLVTEEMYQKLQYIDPVRAQEINFNDRYRLSKALEIFSQTGVAPSLVYKKHVMLPKLCGLILVLLPKRETLYQRINLRSQQMVELGLVEEVKELSKKYPTDLNLWRSIGYRQTLDYLAQFGRDSGNLVNGVETYPNLVEDIAQATRRYAKRQYTYWRNEPKKRSWFERISLLSASSFFYTPYEMLNQSCGFGTLTFKEFIGNEFALLKAENFGKSAENLKSRVVYIYETSF
jgi:tRNA dimethylallyltransferase